MKGLEPGICYICGQECKMMKYICNDCYAEQGYNPVRKGEGTFKILEDVGKK